MDSTLVIKNSHTYCKNLLVIETQYYGHCWMWGSGKPLRFEHWGAREDLLLPIHTLNLAAIPKLDR